MTYPELRWVVQLQHRRGSPSTCPTPTAFLRHCQRALTIPGPASVVLAWAENMARCLPVVISLGAPLPSSRAVLRAGFFRPLPGRAQRWARGGVNRRHAGGDGPAGGARAPTFRQSGGPGPDPAQQVYNLRQRPPCPVTAWFPPGLISVLGHRADLLWFAPHPFGLGDPTRPLKSEKWRAWSPPCFARIASGR